LAKYRLVATNPHQHSSRWCEVRPSVDVALSTVSHHCSSCYYDKPNAGRYKPGKQFHCDQPRSHRRNRLRPNPISGLQVWMNYKEVFQVSGGSLNANVTLPVVSNERFVVQAVDSTGNIAKVVDSITVK
jgi:hypothetical protein